MDRFLSAFLWCAGLFFILGAVGFHNDHSSTAAWIPLLIAGVVLLPPVRSRAAGYLPPIRTAFIILGAFIAVGVMSDENKTQPKHVAAAADTAKVKEEIPAKVESTDAKVPEQHHKPSGCANSDRVCIRAAYDEYKAGILAELEEYRQLEDPVGRAFLANDDMEGNRIAGTLIARGLYRHLRWAFPTNEQMLLTNVPFAEWDSLFSDCRVAIIDMKYLIITISGGRDATGDRRDYLESVQKCEKTFKLNVPQSILRGASSTPSDSAAAKDQTFNFTVAEILKRYDAQLKDEGGDVTKNCRKKKSETTCTFDDTSFQKSIIGMKKLNLS